MTDALVQEFLSMTKEEQARIVTIAHEKHKSGVCFLCSWIVKKIRMDDFPREGRIKHLVLCCAPSSPAVAS